MIHDDHAHPPAHVPHRGPRLRRAYPPAPHHASAAFRGRVPSRGAGTRPLDTALAAHPAQRKPRTRPHTHQQWLSSPAQPQSSRICGNHAHFQRHSPHTRSHKQRSGRPTRGGTAASQPRLRRLSAAGDPFIGEARLFGQDVRDDAGDGLFDHVTEQRDRRVDLA